MKTPKTIPTQLMSADLGAGNVKIYSKREGFPISYPSIISYVNHEDYFVGFEQILPPDIFRCIRSTNERLNGKSWFTSTSVKDRGLPADDPGTAPNLKVENALPLFLSALLDQELIEEGQNNIVLVASHHDAKNKGPALKNELVGAHEIEYNDRKYQIQIQMPKQAVVLEGQALSMEGKNFISVDLGYLTALLLAHGKKGAITQHQPIKLGVSTLVERIYRDDDLRDALDGVMPQRAAIAKAIQNPIGKGNKVSLKYVYGNDEADLTAIYKKHLLNWVKDAFVPVRSLLHTEGSETILVVGGGAKLPFIHDLLNKMKIVPFKGDPLFANVTSIYEQYLEPELTKEENVKAFEFQPFEKQFSLKPPAASAVAA